MEKEMRQREAIRMMKWIAQYPKIVNRIVNVEQCTTPEECIETIELLEECGFEYLVPLLLYTVDYDIVMDRVISKLHAEGMAKIWGQMGMACILNDIKHKIREEIKRENESMGERDFYEIQNNSCHSRL